MFSKSKKVLGIALAATMIAAAFAGCTEQGNASSAGGGESNASAASATEVKNISIDEVMKDSTVAFGDEGADGSEIKLKVWAANDAIEVFQKQCDAFADNFTDRKISIEVVAQGESDAASALMNDPDEAADVFGFVSDQASKLYPDKYVAKVRANFQQPIKDETLEGAVAAASYKTDEDEKESLYAYPETGDNGYVMFYNKSLVSEEQIGSMEGIMEACKASNTKLMIDIDNGFYACMIPLTGGGTYSLGENNNQLLDYDYGKIAPVAKAFSDITVNNSANFANDDVDKALASGFKNKKVAAGVCGTWKTKAIKAALGDDYAAAKLPTLKVDGKDTQIISMFGYKLIGVNAKTDYPMAAQSLAYYLSSEQCQKERISELGWGPSVTSLVESKDVTDNVALKAIYDQQQYSVPQVGLAGSFWDPTGGFGVYLTDSKNDLSDAGIKKAYDQMYENITAQ